MNKENFITGYPGHESEHRAAMKKVLGQENYEFFFDKWLEYFFTDADAVFFASLGLNALRLPFNYRHFEDDMNPRVLKGEGFKHLDRVIDLCAKHDIYTILDGARWTKPRLAGTLITTLPGRLFGIINTIKTGNPWVAGYNPINEPCDPEHVRLPAFYQRLERPSVPDHILWLDGNTFAMEFVGFEPLVSGPTKLPNTAYSNHDYNSMGFPSGDAYLGTDEQKSRLEKSFRRKAEWMAKYDVPCWNGEFGPVYSIHEKDEAAKKINEQRYNMLAEQLNIYDKHAIPWSIWLYKDIGLQGMIYTDPESKWNRTIAPSLQIKVDAQLDAWGSYPGASMESVMAPLVAELEKVNPDAKDEYPTPWNVECHVRRAVLQTFLSRTLSDKFAQQFSGMGKEELEECAKSFHFDQCKKRDGLNDILRDHAKLSHA
ncbi:hypothetical protein VC83_06658 [Pseudogymnoascus destructans]|uniref:Glycoside hydrolase family 5 domain-containing protein n=1 Tax=Pseudogymnoascus destructans TaxID=655981 RepID=A0A177A5G9_9PEZI|nr:uncharacterized protein VC83_06658 [Pseudogymnoascus destructans]OAF56343.1 hypothetical protein VC83_06658 [Pseudogymnoascus destructans]